MMLQDRLRREKAMHCVYVIRNDKGRHYIGYTSNVEHRLKKHAWHGSRWTKDRGPWELVISEEFKDKRSAMLREQQIKSYKGGNAFKKLIQNAVGFAKIV